MGRVGDWVLGQRLGAGASGEVWRAVHADDGRPAAVKRLRAGTDRRAIEREVRAMAALDHPNVLRVFDPRIADGAPFVVTELADGDLASEVPRDPDAALFDVLDGLAHAHARGVVHRDLKAANVLRRGDRHALADFGLAWTGMGGPRRAGTPTSMAPEQLLGRTEDLGPWTDLYAVGCLAFALWTGRPLFEAPTVEALIALHLGAPPPLDGSSGRPSRRTPGPASPRWTGPARTPPLRSRGARSSPWTSTRWSRPRSRSRRRPATPGHPRRPSAPTAGARRGSTSR